MGKGPISRQEKGGSSAFKFLFREVRQTGPGLHDDDVVSCPANLASTSLAGPDAQDEDGGDGNIGMGLTQLHPQEQQSSTRCPNYAWPG